MSIRPARARPRPPNPTLERRQREYEVAQALEAARHLQARLEMLADQGEAVALIRALRNDLAGELQAFVGDPPCQPFSEVER